MDTRARSLFVVCVGLFVAACSGGQPSGSVAPAVPTGSPSAAAPTASVEASATTEASSPSVATSASDSASASAAVFTSKTYGYSLTPPAGWSTIQATAKWDGKGAPFHDVPEADQFVSGGPASAWFFGAPTTKDLKARVAETVAVNAKEHGDTCPPLPESQDPIDIGGQPGVLLAFDCGILINSAVTVHDGIAYVFGFRDPSVHAATDPTDRATFLALLKSVKFPSS